MKRISHLAEVLSLIQPGARIVLHSGCAEPATLIAQLVALAPQLDDVEILTLATMGPAPYAAPELHRHLRLATFSPGRALRKAASAGMVRILRNRLSQIGPAFRNGELKADLILLKLSPPDEAGRMSLGVSVDYMRAVIEQDTIVIAEIDPAMPRICGDTTVFPSEVDYFIEGAGGPHAVSAGVGDDTDRRIAAQIAGLLWNGCTIQTGVGGIPDAVMLEISQLSDLGVHTGVITDAVQRLVEQGVITNARKKVYAGKTITTMAAGSRAFYQFLDGNPAVELHPCSLTHDPAFLGTIEGLCAINCVLEIDLAGRANAERLDGRIISAPGGLPDFATGAKAAPGGISIVALRSTSKDGETSRICARLPARSPVTLGAAQIDYVVTEHGVARLSEFAAGDNARALTAIAHPDFRADLARDLARVE